MINIKKLGSIILIICVLGVVATVFTACKSTSEHAHEFETIWTRNDKYHWHACQYTDCRETSQKGEHIYANDVCSVCGNKKTTDLNNNQIDTVPCSYEVVSAPMTRGLVVIDSASVSNENLYFVDLGYATRVPIWSGGAVSYDATSSAPPQVVFSASSQIQSTVEKTISNTISKTVANSTVDEIEFKAEFGIDEVFKLSGGYSREWGTTVENSNSTTNTFSMADSIAQSYSNGATFCTGGCGYGSYRLSMLATFDIYALLKTNYNNTKTLEITYITCPREDAQLVLEYSANGKWTNDSAKKITLPNNYLSFLKIPDRRIIDDKTYSLTVSGTSVDILDSPMSTNYSGETYFKIVVPSEYMAWVTSGQLHVEVTARCNATLKYRSHEAVAEATIQSRFGEDNFSTITTLTAIGDVWPLLSINPNYGNIVSDNTSIIKTDYLITEDTITITLGYNYIIKFAEYQNWAGGTNAVTFKCDFSNITYRFYMTNLK